MKDRVIRATQAAIRLHAKKCKNELSINQVKFINGSYSVVMIQSIQKGGLMDSPTLSSDQTRRRLECRFFYSDMRFYLSLASSSIAD